MQLAKTPKACINPAMHELLHEYCLATLSPEDTEKFELHLFTCEVCRQEITQMDRVFDIMRQNREYFKERLSSSQKLHARSKPAKLIQMWKYAIAAVLVMGIGWAALLNFLTSPYYSLAKLTSELALGRLKSESSSSDFTTAREHLQQNKYEAAIAAFTAHLQTHPQDFQANYFLGLAHLAAGESNWLGWRRFSTKHAKASIRYLQIAMQLAGENQFYRENCLWLLGKAWLRLENVEQAKQAWRMLLALPSLDLLHKEETRRALAELEKLQP